MKANNAPKSTVRKNAEDYSLCFIMKYWKILWFYKNFEALFLVQIIYWLINDCNLNMYGSLLRS